MHSLSKAERIKGIKKSKGIEYFINKAYEILGNPILIHDMEYKIIAINKDVITDDPIWNEYAATGTASKDWLDFFKNECFLEEAANTKKITFLTSDKLNYDRIFCKLFNKNNIQVGCAVMLACNQPFTGDDPLLFEELCDHLSKMLGRIDFYNDYGQVYFEKLIDELIAGVNDIALYAAHVESIYMHLKSNLYLAVADIGHSDSVQLAQYRNLLKKTQPDYAYAVYSRYILIIIGIDESKLYIEKDLKQLNQFFRKGNIYAGVSRSFENLFDLQKYFNEALMALSSRPEGTDQRIFLLEELACSADE